MLIPSPKVATYDLQPEMSLPKVAASLEEAIRSGEYDLLVANFANPDMVGHTGVLAAALNAVKAVDGAVGDIAKAILEMDGMMLLTADHGNIEEMIDEQGQPHTAHTTDLVPLILVSKNQSLSLDNSQIHNLSNIAPTLLDMMGISKPAEMTSESLLIRSKVTA